MTWLDFILFFFMGLSAFLAYARGFSREVLTIFSWGASVFSCFIFFPLFQDWGQELLQPGWLADFVLIGAIFLTTLLIFGGISFLFSRCLLDREIGIIDRLLGIVFGLIRGLFIVGVGYLLFTAIVSEKNRPPWVSGALTRGLLDQSGNILLSLLPDTYENLATEKQDRDKKNIRKKEKEDKAHSYPESSRQDLERIMEKAKSDKE